MGTVGAIIAVLATKASQKPLILVLKNEISPGLELSDEITEITPIIADKVLTEALVVSS